MNERPAGAPPQPPAESPAATGAVRSWLAGAGGAGVLKVVAGNGSFVVLGFVANLIAANGLSPDGFGLMALALAMLNVLQEVCGAGVDLAIVRIAAPHVGRDADCLARVYRAGLQIKLIFNGSIALAVWMFAGPIARGLFDDPRLSPLLGWVAVGLLAAALFNYMLAKFQTEERFALYSTLRVLNNVAKLVFLGLLAWIGLFEPVAVFASWMLAFVVSFGMALVWDRRTTLPGLPVVRIEGERWGEILRFARWTVASSFLYSLYSRTDLLILARYVGDAEVGLYAVSWNITFVIDLVTYSVIVALLPRASKMSTHGEFVAYLKSTFLICALLALCVMPLFLLSDWLFATFFPAYGTAAASLFRILLSGALITLLFHPLYLILYARDQAYRLTQVNLLLVLFVLLAGLLVIPAYGTTGAALVTVAGRVFASALICYFVFSEVRKLFHAQPA
jgi:O-antigen/teichoic acid export membrane protein